MSQDVLCQYIFVVSALMNDLFIFNMNQEIDMKEADDGDDDLVLYLSDIKGVMQDLVGEESLDGHFFYQFQEQKDKRGVRVCGEGNGSLSFQAAAAAIGPGKVPLSLVPYLDGTYCLNNIEARVLYSKSTSSSNYISFPSPSMSDSDLFLLTVTSRNISLSMSSSPIAYRVLGLLPIISKAANCRKSNSWINERRCKLLHACVREIVKRINQFCSEDHQLKYPDGLTRITRGFLHHLITDGLESALNTLCTTSNCASCWCPADKLHDTSVCSMS